jgi:hypothetical protein
MDIAYVAPNGKLTIDYNFITKQWCEEVDGIEILSLSRYTTPEEIKRDNIIPIVNYTLTPTHRIDFGHSQDPNYTAPPEFPLTFK